MIAATAHEHAMLIHSGRITARVLSELVSQTRSGVTTASLNEYADTRIRSLGGIPSFLNYRPQGKEGKAYPAAICTSVNEEAVHGVPSARVIQRGDIIGIDIGTNYQGFFTDAATTVPVGEVSPIAHRLIMAARDALLEGIAASRVGGHLGDIGAAVEECVLRAGFRVIRSLTGHGVGRSVHEDPYVLNYGTRGEGAELSHGMVIAIEPIISVGTERVVLEADGHGYRTSDGSLAAHEEHTILITHEGPRILTHYEDSRH